MPRRLLVAALLWVSLACAACGEGHFAGRDSTIRMLALGDSYTAGIGIEEPERWSEQLAARLREAGLQIETETLAGSGWRVGDLLRALDAASPPSDFDLVTVFIGANDHFTGRPPALFESELRLLLDRASALARGKPSHVLVIGLPDWTVTPGAAGFEVPQDAGAILDLYNEILEREARERGAGFVGLVEQSRAHDAGADLFVPDGLHPNAELSRIWADVAFEEAAQILE